MRTTFLLATSLTFGVFGLVCGACSSAPPAPLAREARSDTTASQASVASAGPEVSAAELQTLAADNAAFARDALRVVGAKLQGESFVLSPFSISEVMAMAYAGARGATESEMAGALHFSLPQARLHAAFGAVDDALAQRGKGARTPGEDGTPFKLSLANSLWGDEGVRFLAPFVDTLTAHYDAALHTAPFRTRPDEGRASINRWVSDATAGFIPELLGQGTIDRSTRLVLVNAIHLNAPWALPFDAAKTVAGPFQPLTGAAVSVPMMHKLFDELPYATDADKDVFDLAYDNGELAMRFVVPKAGHFLSVEAAVGPELLAPRAGLSAQRVNLSLPTFAIQGAAISLRDALSSMGMASAFDAAHADFSGMAADRLVVSDVIHQAVIKVIEKGTEASAATAIGMVGTSLPAGPIFDVKVDRPFLFSIYDRQTGATLFAGRVMKPSM